MNEKELMKKLEKVICKNCSHFKSEHRTYCPKSGRTKKFEPGGYTEIPTELLLLILR